MREPYEGRPDAPVNGMVGRYFEAYPGGTGRESAREEGRGSTLRRHLGQTLKRMNPKRVSASGRNNVRFTGDDAVGGSNPLKRPVRATGSARDRGVGGDAGGAASKLIPAEVLGCPAGRKSHEGKTDREVTSLSDGGQALKGEPQERCDAPLFGAWRQVTRGGKRHRRSNVRGAMDRGWHPGATAEAVGRFARLVRAEGERNPMGGGVSSDRGRGACCAARSAHRPTRVIRRRGA